MSNDRNAGRKPLITDEQMKIICERHCNGESLIKLAEEYGVTRQALHKRLHAKSEQPIKIDWTCDGELVTTIEADFKKRNLTIVNYAEEISKRPFGFNNTPSWNQFTKIIEDRYFESQGAAEPGTYLMTDGEKGVDLNKITGISIHDVAEIPVFEFQKKDLLITRTDTDGFQMKALSDDRRFFIKSQAVISGVRMQDWAVEIIAAHIADQLGIPCVNQIHCRVAYAGRTWDGVYSKNFEIDGYTFVSFESLIGTKNLSTKDDSFIRMGSIEKLRWCAGQISDICGIGYKEAEKYMLDLAVLDCLIGNVDRHTHNFGVFFNSNTGEYSIPLIFDNGMGLFEHDYYRDEYKSFDEAMNNVYVAPYGEDPFGFLRELNKHFHLKQIYAARNITYLNILNTPFALEYERRMRHLWLKFD